MTLILIVQLTIKSTMKYIVILILLTGIYASHTDTETYELINNDTVCLPIVGEYGNFNLYSTDLINATLYENNHLEDTCNNYHSEYCKLRGQPIHIIDVNHNYNICMNAIVTDTVVTIEISYSKRPDTIIYLLTTSAAVLAIWCGIGFLYGCLLLIAYAHDKCMSPAKTINIELIDYRANVDLENLDIQV